MLYLRSSFPSPTHFLVSDHIAFFPQFLVALQIWLSSSRAPLFCLSCQFLGESTVPREEYITTLFLQPRQYRLSLTKRYENTAIFQLNIFTINVYREDLFYLVWRKIERTAGCDYHLQEKTSLSSCPLLPVNYNWSERVLPTMRTWKQDHYNPITSNLDIMDLHVFSTILSSLVFLFHLFLRFLT